MEQKRRYDPYRKTEGLRKGIDANSTEIYACGYDDGHADGYEEGCADTKETDNNRKHAFKDGHKQGQAEAWEVARRILVDPKSGGGFSLEELIEIFQTISLSRIFKDNTFEQAAEKIRKYEEKKKEQEDKICIGDEVKDPLDNIWIVTSIDELGDACGFSKYCVEHWSICELEKTGRHFEIQGILAQMGE